MSTENWLSIPTVCCSFLSIISCLCVIIISYKQGYILSNKTQSQLNIDDNNNMKRDNIKRDNKISMEIICIICVCDGLWSIELFLNWIRQIEIEGINITYWTNIQCIILGIYSQFLGCLSPLWHCLLAYHLCYLLFGGSLNTLKKQKYYHYFLILFLGFIATLIPLIPPSDHYGIYINPKLSINSKTIIDRECWLKNTKYQIIWTVISLSSLLLHYLALLIAFYRWKQTSFFVLSPIYYEICKKILRFVVVYTILRLPATIDRLIEIFNNKSYFTLIAINHYFQALIGVANFIVFAYNTRDNKINDNKTRYKLFNHNYYNNNNNNKNNDNYDNRNMMEANNELADSSILTSPHYNIQRSG